MPAHASPAMERTTASTIGAPGLASWRLMSVCSGVSSIRSTVTISTASDSRFRLSRNCHVATAIVQSRLKRVQLMFEDGRRFTALTFAAAFCGAVAAGPASAQVEARIHTSDDTLLRLGSYAFEGGETLTLTVGIGSGAARHPNDPPNMIWTIG